MIITFRYYIARTMPIPGKTSKPPRISLISVIFSRLLVFSLQSKSDSDDFRQILTWHWTACDYRYRTRAIFPFRGSECWIGGENNRTAVIRPEYHRAHSFQLPSFPSSSDPENSCARDLSPRNPMAAPPLLAHQWYLPLGSSFHFHSEYSATEVGVSHTRTDTRPEMRSCNVPKK